MEPRIQYAKTTDGVSIAFWTLGEGPPLVIMPPTVMASHCELEWHWPEWRRWYERLAGRRKLVRYDGRGGGLSDRNVADVSPEARLLDLEAVVEHLGLERFALFGALMAGPLAVAYAARHPERLSHLLLWCTYARTIESQSLAIRGLGGLMDKDWVLYTEAFAHHVLGWSETEMARQMAAFIRECVTPEVLRAHAESLRQFDATDLLPQVKSPTLVLHRRQLAFPPVEFAKGLASRIPDARLAVLEGALLLPYVGDTEAVLRAIDEFLGEGEEAAPTAEPPAPGGFRTVLFTDVEGSTALTQRLGDARAREVLREHEGIVREALKSHGGAEVKTMGDGFMASFASATKALECAVSIQRALAVGAGLVPPQGAASSAPTEAIRVRIGLNAGEPVAEGGDLFGTAVNLAARIAAQADGGEILASDVVRQLVAGKGFLFADRGDVALRGFEDPVRLYEVRWREE